MVDQFGDHLLVCDHGAMSIHQHDALCDVVFHILLQDNSYCKREKHFDSNLDRPWDVFYPDFSYGKPAYFDVTVRKPLQDSLLSQSSMLADVAASRGEVEKGVHHEQAVLGARGFSSLCCGDPGALVSCCLKVLRDIAIRAANRNGVGIALACHHFLEQLSVCLWRHNSCMFLHHFSLLPVNPLWKLSPAVDSPAHGFSHT